MMHCLAAWLVNSPACQCGVDHYVLGLYAKHTLRVFKSWCDSQRLPVDVPLLVERVVTAAGVTAMYCVIAFALAQIRTVSHMMVLIELCMAQLSHDLQQLWKACPCAAY